MKRIRWDELHADASRWGFWGSLGGLAVAVSWGLGMFAIGGLPPYDAITRHPLVFRLTFLSCFLGPLFEVAVLVALVVVALPRAPVRAVVGALIAFIYAPLNLSCYFLNGALLPRLYSTSTPSALEQTLGTMIMMDHRYSLLFALDVLGYALLSIGLSLSMSALWRRSRSWTGATFFTGMCAVSCTVGVVGIALDNRTLTQGVVVGGAIAVVSSILTAVAFHTEGRLDGAPGDLLLAA